MKARKPKDRGWLISALALASAGSGLALITTWWRSTGDVTMYVTRSVPAGQLAYVLSKLFGLLGVMALAVQLTTALLRSLGLLRVSQRAHIVLGVASASCIAAHVGAFLTASKLRSGHSALDLLVPRFDNGFYRQAESLGSLALWLVVLTLIGSWRRRRARALGRWLHRGGLLAFLFAVLHAGAIGTETRMALTIWIGNVWAASTCVLVLYRSITGIRPRPGSVQEVSSDA